MLLLESSKTWNTETENPHPILDKLTRPKPQSTGRYEKYIITNGIIEVYRYQCLNTKGNGGVLDGDGEFKDQNYKVTQRKRRNNLRRLITMNFDEQSKFVTLTFRDSDLFDIQSVKACNVQFNLFIKRLKYKLNFPDLKYVAVIEFQDKNGRGAVHYHMVCNLPFLENSQLSQIWDNGFTKITAIDKVDNIGAYIVKYMTSDIDDTRLQGLRAYNFSRGLKRPLEAVSWKTPDHDKITETLERLNEKSPSYSSKYESEFNGQIEYYQYNFNRTT